MITGIKKLLQQADRIIWGPWLIFLLLGTGCYLMLSLRFLPLKHLKAGREQRAREYLRFLP